MQQLKFIEAIGMTPSGYYSSLENHSLKLKTLFRIAEVLKVSVKVLFTDADELTQATFPQIEKELTKQAVEIILQEATSKIRDIL